METKILVIKFRNVLNKNEYLVAKLSVPTACTYNVHDSILDTLLLISDFEIVSSVTHKNA